MRFQSNAARHRRDASDIDGQVKYRAVVGGIEEQSNHMNCLFGAWAQTWVAVAARS
jgi:hypothetical protein